MDLLSIDVQRRSEHTIKLIEIQSEQQKTTTSTMIREAKKKKSVSF